MMRCKRRLIPVNLQDIPAIETWLADLAEQGLFLTSCGSFFAKFERAEPAKATYRLEPTANILVRTDPDNKKNQFYQEFGWEYVCTFGNDFHVYRSMLENPPEIHTDPKEFANAFRRIIYAQAFSFLIYFGLLLYLCRGTLSMANLIKQGTPMLLSLAFWIALPVASAFRFLRLYRIYRRLQGGSLLEHSSDYRKRLPLRYLQRVAPMVAFVAILSGVYGLAFQNDWDGQQEIPESFPMVSLAEIEREDSLQLVPPGDYGNCILRNQTFLAPEQYTVRQVAFCDGRHWAYGALESYSPSLILEIYRLRFPALAKPTLYSLKRYATRYDTWETEVLKGLGAEEAYLCSNKESPWRQVFLRAGDTVVCVSYHGESDIRPFLPKFAALAQADFSAIKP